MATETKEIEKKPENIPVKDQLIGRYGAEFYNMMEAIPKSPIVLAHLTSFHNKPIPENMDDFKSLSEWLLENTDPNPVLVNNQTAQPDPNQFVLQIPCTQMAYGKASWSCMEVGDFPVALTLEEIRNFRDSGMSLPRILAHLRDSAEDDGESIDWSDDSDYDYGGHNTTGHDGFWAKDVSSAETARFLRWLQSIDPQLHDQILNQ